MNGKRHESDFPALEEADRSALESALAERLREWDPVRREAPPSAAEQAWFRERLLAEARAEASASSASIGGWVRLAAVVGALLLVTASLVLVRRDRSLPVSQPQVQAAEVPAGGSEAAPAESELPALPAAPVAIAEVTPEVTPELIPAPEALPDGPVAPSDVTVEAAAAAPAVRARQLQMRGASGTRLLWTFDPDFEMGEAGE